MELPQELLAQNVLEYLSEGVLILNTSGRIQYANRAAANILAIPQDALSGKTLRQAVDLDETNDDFMQLVIDAVMDKTTRHKGVVNYFNGTALRRLIVTSSFLMQNGEKAGLTLLLNDITELDYIKSTFERYMPRQAARQLMNADNGQTIQASKQEVSVLLCDLRGFTALCEELPAMQVSELLGRFLSTMSPILEKYHGSMLEFLGDGFLAVFGAPEPAPNHAALSVAAGIAMQQAMQALNHRNEADGLPTVQLGIGINTGEAVLGSIGSADRMSYNILGSTVNLAGRTESYTSGSQVFITQFTYDAIAEPLTVLKKEQVEPKGVRHPITLYSIGGIGGDFNLHFTKETFPLRPALYPAEVSFAVLDGKHLSSTHTAGRIVSASRQQAVLMTDAPLEPGDNLALLLGPDAKLYAKAAARTESGWLLDFTFVPPLYTAWSRRLWNQE